jgi:hypothetical protein
MEDGEGGDGGRRLLVRACLLSCGLSALVCLVVLCLSAPALVLLYLVPMGICWLGFCRRDSC